MLWAQFMHSHSCQLGLQVCCHQKSTCGVACEGRRCKKQWFDCTCVVDDQSHRSHHKWVSHSGIRDTSWPCWTKERHSLDGKRDRKGAAWEETHPPIGHSKFHRFDFRPCIGPCNGGGPYTLGVWSRPLLMLGVDCEVKRCRARVPGQSSSHVPPRMGESPRRLFGHEWLGIAVFRGFRSWATKSTCLA